MTWPCLSAGPFSRSASAQKILHNGRTFDPPSDTKVASRSEAFDSCTYQFLGAGAGGTIQQTGIASGGIVGRADCETLTPAVAAEAPPP